MVRKDWANKAHNGVRLDMETECAKVNEVLLAQAQAKVDDRSGGAGTQWSRLDKGFGKGWGKGADNGFGMGLGNGFFGQFGEGGAWQHSSDSTGFKRGAGGYQEQAWKKHKGGL